jgi:hypothetical protein
LELPDGTAIDTLTTELSVLGAPGPNSETHGLTITGAAAETTAWPLGALVGDVVFSDESGVVIATSRFSILVTRGVTNAT